MRQHAFAYKMCADFPPRSWQAARSCWA